MVTPGGCWGAETPGGCCEAVMPGVYLGTVRHRRRSPVAHEFTYPLFMMLLDIDEIPALMRVSPFTSHNRWNWAAFHDTDHLRHVAPAGQPDALRARLAASASAAGISLPAGRVFLLTHLRYLGYVFNPISLFYCYTPAGELGAVLAEVNNTAGGTHPYWLRVRSSGRGRHAAAADKALYVSPFLEDDIRYAFRFAGPGNGRIVVHVDADAAGRRLFDATLDLEGRAWTRREVHRALARHPWMTARVIGAIHREALCLWWKGVPVVRGRARPGARRTA